MKIEIETCLDREMQIFLDKKYCDKCKIVREPGCCVACKTVIGFEIIKGPTMFVK